MRLLDLVGFVAGYGLAALLARSLWPRAAELAGPPLVALGLEFAWLGLAMSGPIVLGLDPRRARAPRSARPDRPGRPIGAVVVVPRSVVGPASRPPEGGAQYSRAELAWLAIGGYWIALTFLVIPARATDAPWTLAGAVPIVGAFGLLLVLPRRPRPPGTSADLGWTHAVAVGLLWTWPIAWVLLVLLGKTL